jgi:hypothetical protein
MQDVAGVCAVSFHAVQHVERDFSRDGNGHRGS